MSFINFEQTRQIALGDQNIVNEIFQSILIDGSVYMNDLKNAIFMLDANEIEYFSSQLMVHARYVGFGKMCELLEVIKENASNKNFDFTLSLAELEANFSYLIKKVASEMRKHKDEVMA